MAVKKLRRDDDVSKKDHHLRLFHLNEGLPSLTSLRAELQDMWDTLLGRIEPPIPSRSVQALMEVADAFYARAGEITAMIQKDEADGLASPSYRKFRTGELRTFMEVAKRAADLGSRRITVRGMEIEAARLGRDSKSG